MISVEPNASQPTIALVSVSGLRLPLFDHCDCSVCKASLLVPTRGGLYTSSSLLECSHKLEGAEIVLGLDWMFQLAIILCDDRTELEDLCGYPGISLRQELLHDDLIDIDIALSKMNSCMNVVNFDLPITSSTFHYSHLPARVHW